MSILVISNIPEQLTYSKHKHTSTCCNVSKQYPNMYPGGHGQDAAKNWPVGNPSLHQIAQGPSEMSYNGRGGYSPQQQQQSADESLGPGGPMGQQIPGNYKPPGYQWNGYQAPPGYEPGDKIGGNVPVDGMRAQNAPPPGYERKLSR